MSSTIPPLLRAASSSTEGGDRIDTDLRETIAAFRVRAVRGTHPAAATTRRPREGEWLSLVVVVGEEEGTRTVEVRDAEGIILGRVCHLAARFLVPLLERVQLDVAGDAAREGNVAEDEGGEDDPRHAHSFWMTVEVVGLPSMADQIIAFLASFTEGLFISFRGTPWGGNVRGVASLTCAACNWPVHEQVSSSTTSSGRPYVMCEACGLFQWRETSADAPRTPAAPMRRSLVMPELQQQQTGDSLTARKTSTISPGDTARAKPADMPSALAPPLLRLAQPSATGDAAIGRVHGSANPAVWFNTVISGIRIPLPSSVARRTSSSHQLSACTVLLKTPLLKHQVEGVEFMLARERGTEETGPLFFQRSEDEGKLVCTVTNATVTSPPPPPCRGGIITDEPGTGRHLQFLALVLGNPSQAATARTTLVVCSSPAAAEKWIEQIALHVDPALAPLRAFRYYRGYRGDLDAMCATHDFVLTTSDALMRSEARMHSSSSTTATTTNNLNALSAREWWRVIVEAESEADVKRMVRACAGVRAARRWLLVPHLSVEWLPRGLGFVGLAPLNDYEVYARAVLRPVLVWMRTGVRTPAFAQATITLTKALRHTVLRRTRDETIERLLPRLVHKDLGVETGGDKAGEEDADFYASVDRECTRFFQRLGYEGLLAHRVLVEETILALMLRCANAAPEVDRRGGGESLLVRLRAFFTLATAELDAVFCASALDAIPISPPMMVREVLTRFKSEFADVIAEPSNLHQEVSSSSSTVTGACISSPLFPSALRSGGGSSPRISVTPGSVGSASSSWNSSPRRATEPHRKMQRRLDFSEADEEDDAANVGGGAATTFGVGSPFLGSSTPLRKEAVRDAPVERGVSPAAIAKAGAVVNAVRELLEKKKKTTTTQPSKPHGGGGGAAVVMLSNSSGTLRSLAMMLRTEKAVGVRTWFSPFSDPETVRREAFYENLRRKEVVAEVRGASSFTPSSPLTTPTDVERAAPPLTVFLLHASIVEGMKVPPDFAFADRLFVMEPCLTTRAERIVLDGMRKLGQESAHVRVVRLAMRGTVEERALRVGARRRALEELRADAARVGGTSWLSSTRVDNEGARVRELEYMFGVGGV